MTKKRRDYNSDLLRGNIDSLLLYLIDELGNTYGYELIKTVEKKSKGYFQFKEGTVYPALRKLENQGLVRGEWKKLPNGLERRYYTITENGKQVLEEKMNMWQDFISAMELILRPHSG